MTKSVALFIQNLEIQPNQLLRDFPPIALRGQRDYGLEWLAMRDCLVGEISAESFRLIEFQVNDCITL